MGAGPERHDQKYHGCGECQLAHINSLRPYPPQCKADANTMAIHRIIHHDTDEPWYGLHDVKFDDDGNVTWWDREPAQFRGDGEDGPEGLAQMLLAAAGDAERWPALKESVIPNSGDA